MSDWNVDIDQAPKNGTEILVRFTTQGNVSKIVNWNKIHKRWQSKGEPQVGLIYQPLVWMILPEYTKEMKYGK